MPSLLSVNDAASLLNVNRSQVHRLLDGGHLRGRTIGNQRVVFAESVNEYRLVRPSAGRPLEPRAAWARLFDAHPASIEELGPLAATTRRRAVVHYCHVIPYRLEELDQHPDVVATGAAGAARHGANIGATDPRQFYVRAAGWEQFKRTYALDDADSDLNLIARIVPDDAWPFGDDEEVAPLIVCAVDAYSVADLRSAHEALDRMTVE